MTDNGLEVPIRAITVADGVSVEDNWFAVRPLDGSSLAIGEPAYHQCNWSYLVSDQDESLLWDTGSGRRPIGPLVQRHAKGQVTAFPSHMHYDHLGGINDFGPVMLADLPMLRMLEQDGWVTPTEEMFLGAYEGLSPPRFEVRRWVAPGEVIEIGQRRLEVLHTPGHSPDSVSLWESERARLYAADFVYRGPLYAQTPGASLMDYRRVLRLLLERLPQDVEIVCAHGQEEDGVFDVPMLGYGDLEAVAGVVDRLLEGPAHDGEERVTEDMTLLYSEASFSD